jgi:hypothetical protein
VAVMVRLLAHVPAKACPGLDPGWGPVRRQEHAPLYSGMTLLRIVIPLQLIGGA